MVGNINRRITNIDQIAKSSLNNSQRKAVMIVLEIVSEKVLVVE